MTRDAVINCSDGVTQELPGQRFNLRMSNTEPLFRLNVETRMDDIYQLQRIEEVPAAIHKYA